MEIDVTYENGEPVSFSAANGLRGEIIDGKARIEQKEYSSANLYTPASRSIVQEELKKIPSIEEAEVVML